MALAAGGARAPGWSALSALCALDTLEELGAPLDELRSLVPAPTTWIVEDPWVPIADALRLVERIEQRFSQIAPVAFARRWIERHPTLRALSELAASPLAWLDLFLPAFAALHPLGPLRWRATPDRLELDARLADHLGSSARWARVVHEIVRQAPTVLGAPPLEPERVAVADSGLGAVYRVVRSGSIAARVARRSDTPFAAILGALASLAERAPAVGLAEPESRASSVTPSPVEAFGRRYALTLAELRVLGLLNSGLRPSEIAGVLAIDLTTVRAHLKRVYAKTGTSGQRAVIRSIEQSTLL